MHKKSNKIPSFQSNFMLKLNDNVENKIEKFFLEEQFFVYM